MRHQKAILCNATVTPLCFWIMMFPLSESRHNTGISVGSEVSLAACWARTDITRACSSDRVPRQPRLSPCESVTRTPSMDGFFTVSSKCYSEVASIPPTVCQAQDRTAHGVLLHHQPPIWLFFMVAVYLLIFLQLFMQEILFILSKIV